MIEFQIGLDSGDFDMPFIAAEVDTGVFVEALLKVDPGKNLVAYRELITADQFVATVGKVLGIKVRRANRTPDDLLAILGPEVAPDMIEYFAFMKEYGYAPRVDETLVHPKDVGFISLFFDGTIANVG